MRINFTDPVLFICIGILLIGFVFIVWAVGKLRQKKGDGRGGGEALQDDSPITDAELGFDPLSAPDILQEAPRLEVRTPPPPPSTTSAASKEVADRLEAMTQRLSEMQALLNKQNTATIASAANAPIGQGFSSETVEKLLKIIGNVIQQVDILQKAMNITTKEPVSAPVLNVPPAPKASVPGTPAPLPKPPASPIQPVTSAPGPGTPKPGPAFPPAGTTPKS